MDTLRTPTVVGWKGRPGEYVLAYLRTLDWHMRHDVVHRMSSRRLRRFVHCKMGPDELLMVAQKAKGVIALRDKPRKKSKKSKQSKITDFFRSDPRRGRGA